MTEGALHARDQLLEFLNMHKQSYDKIESGMNGSAGNDTGFANAPQAEAESIHADASDGGSGRGQEL